MKVEPLRFLFSGYSIWLELQHQQKQQKQCQPQEKEEKKVTLKSNDLYAAIQTASDELGVIPIPAPHVTVVYGVCKNWSESKVKQLFRDVITQKILFNNFNKEKNDDKEDIFVVDEESLPKRSTTIKEEEKEEEEEEKNIVWPKLEYKGYRSNVEYFGVDGGEMDMSWIEVIFKTSEQHEALVQLIHNSFNEFSSSSSTTTTTTTSSSSSTSSCTTTTTSSKNQQQQKTAKLLKSSLQRQQPWTPHLSIAYDNPRPIPISKEYVESILHRYPSLTNDQTVEAISLWKTTGTIQCWKCIDRFNLISKK